MSYLDILNETRQNMATANPFENIMRGAQGVNQIQNQLLQNQQAQQTIDQNAAMNPLLMQSRQAELQGQQIQNEAWQLKIDDFQKKERLGQLYRASQAIKPFIEKGDMQGAALAASRFSEYGLPQDVATHVQGLIQSGDIDSVKNGITTIESLAAQDLLGDKPAEVRAFEEMTKGMTPEKKAEAREVWAGIRARSGESAQERIARTGMTGEVAQSEAEIAGAKAGATESQKLKQQLAMEPELEARKTRSTESAKLEAKINDKIVTASRDAKGVNSILDMAETMIPIATGSGIGAGLDWAGSIFGISTTGAEVADSLKSLEGALIMKMPRMEGPQSNLDQQLYRQMAAQIGDSTIPGPRRIAALKTLREITNKYSENEKPAGKKEAPPANDIDDLVNQYAD